MPPRHTYWTIILEGKPTAFRAATQDELLPTLKQLQARHPDAVFDVVRARPAVEVGGRVARGLRPEASAGRSPWPHVAPGRDTRGPARAFRISRDEKRKALSGAAVRR